MKTYKYYQQRLLLLKLRLKHKYNYAMWTQLDEILAEIERCEYATTGHCEYYYE